MLLAFTGCWRSDLGIDRIKIIHNAQLLSSKGKYYAAISEWKKLSAESPGDGSIYNLIGELHLKRNATMDAVASFIKAAHAFRAEGATLKAIATYKKVLKLDPSRYEVYRHLGDLNAERGLLSSAIQEYLTLGKYYLKERKNKEALEIYRTIVSRDPSNLDAQQRVADLCLQENLQDEAATVYLQLGRECSAQQRFAKAKEAYESVLRLDPTNSEAQQFIEHIKNPGGIPASGMDSGDANGLGGGEPPDLLAEASRRIEEKQFAGAEAILNHVLTQEPGSPKACRLLARLHLQQGQLQVALGEYRFLAGAALRAHDYVQAEALIREFLSLEPESVPLLELYGELCELKGEIKAAVQHFEKAIEVLLRHPEPGMPALHEEIFQRVLSMAPESSTVARLAELIRGEASHHHSSAEAPVPAHGVHPLAEEFLLEGASPGDSRSMVKDANSEENLEACISDLAAGESQPPILSTSEQFQAYIKSGQLAQAEDWLGMILNLEPNDAQAREFLGQVLEAKGDSPGAALQYARALELVAEHGNNESDGRLRELYGKVKQLAPGSLVAQRLASLYEPTPSCQGGTSFAQESVENLDPETHYTLGVAFKNMGLFEEAEEEFAFAMKKQDLFFDSCLMTAVCQKEQHKLGAACAQLERLLADSRCQGTKAQAIRYELGLLYEQDQRWQLAKTMFEVIPTFHDVPQRLADIHRLHQSDSPAANAFRYAS